MNPTLFDQIAKRFSEQRLSRRTALSTGLAAGATAAMTGIGAASAQGATPVASPEVVPPTEGTSTQLFVQAFQSGHLAPSTTSGPGTHTITLGHGMGQTIIFTDRPSRDVGVTSTPAFLDGLGFDDDNPPNAAILVDDNEGNIDIAVIELFNPSYDETTNTATYDIAVLAKWRNELEFGFNEQPMDLGDVPEDFGATHLFIDGCRSGSYPCVWWNDGHPIEKGRFADVPVTWWWDGNGCVPDGTADTQTLDEVRAYWAQKCNETFPACEGRCSLWT